MDEDSSKYKAFIEKIIKVCKGFEENSLYHLVLRCKFEHILEKYLRQENIDLKKNL
jgi:hypothetical protein